MKVSKVIEQLSQCNPESEIIFCDINSYDLFEVEFVKEFHFPEEINKWIIQNGEVLDIAEKTEESFNFTTTVAIKSI